jgi:hypothetical protein
MGRIGPSKLSEGFSQSAPSRAQSFQVVVRAVVHDLKADVIGPGGEKSVDPVRNLGRIAPGKQRVNEAIAGLGYVVVGEAEPPPAVRVVRRLAIALHVRPGDCSSPVWVSLLHDSLLWSQKRAVANAARALAVCSGVTR